MKILLEVYPINWLTQVNLVTYELATQFYRIWAGHLNSELSN